MAESFGTGDLVGRQVEISVIDGVLAGLAAGRGSSLLVVGEAGIGKSALLAAAAERAGALGLRVLQGVCDELGGGFPLRAMTALLGVESRGGPHGLPVLSGDPVLARTEHLLGVVDEWCSRGPVVLVLDDLQWADEASLVLWRQLCRVTRQLPLVLLGAGRSVPVREGCTGLRRYLRAIGGRELSVRPLAAEQVSVLVEHWMGSPPGRRLATELASAAGNPLYVREMVDAWSRAGWLNVERGMLELDEKATTDRAGAASLAVTIADRLDFLSPRCMETLRFAALSAAPGFPPTGLGEMTGLGPAEVVEVLEEAIAAGVLEPVGNLLRFRHGLIKQALYETIPEPVRALMVQRITHWLIETGASVECVVSTLGRILGAVDNRTLDWLFEHACEIVGLAPRVAYDLIGHALESLAADDARRVMFEDHLGLVALHLGRFQVSESNACSILAGSRDPERRGYALWSLGYALQRQGRAEEGLALVCDAVGGYPPDSLWHARLTALRAVQLLLLQRFEEADAVAAQALAAGERLSDPMASGYALHVVSSILAARGQPAESVRRIERALAIVEQDPRLTDIKLLMMSNRAAFLADMDRYAESEAEFRRVRAMAERIATPRLALIQMQSAALAFALGRWDEVAAEAEIALDLGFLETDRGHAVDTLGLAAMVAVHRDDVDGCGRLLGLVPAEEPRAAEHHARSDFVAVARALQAERAGFPEQGLAILAESVPGSERIGSIVPVLVLLTLAQMACRLGAGGRVRDAADLAARDTRGMNVPAVEMMVRWCRALADDDPAALLEVAAYYRGCGFVLDMANALEDAAVLEARAGRRDAARAAVTEALAAYSSLDAVWDARRARARLRAEGVQVGARGSRKRPSTGPAALTPTERQVAQLVAGGASNTEIAERLLLSRRTVETHVSRILAKLQVESRREIARVMMP